MVGRRAIFALTLAAWSANACVNNAEPAVSHGSTGGAPSQFGDAQGAIDWKACSDIPSSYKGFELTCGETKAPLRWSNPGGEAIDLRVLRMTPKSTPITSQLWLLQGGPGLSGETLAGLAPLFAPKMPGVEFLLPDHRGVGASNRLSCTTEEDDDSANGATITFAEWPQCLAAVQQQWGADLAAVDSRGAALDLGHLIAAARQDKLPVRLYGVSYGTFWALRYLQQFPDQVDRVVLDSACPPGSCNLSQFWNNHEAAAKSLLDLCAKDAFCAGKMGSNPWGKLQAVLADVASGACPQLTKKGLSHDNLRMLFAALIRDEGLRTLIAPLVYRLGRCNEQDIAALQSLASAMASNKAMDPKQSQALRKQFAPVLHHNVVANELLQGTPAGLGQLLFAPPDAIEDHQVYAKWPLGPADPLRLQLPDVKVPVLVLAGGLDPQTPALWGKFVTDKLPQVARKVEIARAAHGLAGGAGDVGKCARSVMVEFLANPKVAPFATCATQQAPIDFEHGEGQVLTLFKDGLWETTAGTKRGPLAETADGDSLRAALEPLFREVERGM